MKQAYCTLPPFRKTKRILIERANQIIAEYQADNLVLTLRQLYYQFVSRDWIPNRMESYKQLGGAVNDGRLVGMIDWDAIEDRTRNVSANSHWTHPRDILQSAAYSFRIDKWKTQPKRVEVWVEKEALSGVFANLCSEMDVALMACKGYMSQSEIRSAGVRMRHYRRAGQKTVVIHFGDHDPSGIDMTRDVRERLCMFAECDVAVERVALNFDQIEKYEPPPNPAKVTDSRFAAYEQEYGDESWELDALNPRTLRDLVQVNVKKHRNEKLWKAAVAEEDAHKKDLELIADYPEAAAEGARTAYGESGGKPERYQDEPEEDEGE